MKILLTGVSGQLGGALLPHLQGRGDVITATRADMDLTVPGSVTEYLSTVQPDVIINPAAWTAVDDAEDDVDGAMAANAESPARMAEWAAESGAALVHYSTDYVFDGRKGAEYVETDTTGPLNVYGRSKLEGEQAVLRSGARHVVLRSSWIYAPTGKNFVLTMLRLARQGRDLSVVDDQVGSPTSAASLARATIAALDADLPAQQAPGGNLYHCVDRGAVSWYTFAGMVFDQAIELGLLDKRPGLAPTDSAGFPQKATRPAYSPLDNTRFEQASGLVMPRLQASLSACLKELKELEQQ
ncbi:dTDP-4-dehydrorhamnose reductase [Marinihelvus fidelis]|uniref:dTDP-4-dehydrorhamnose reductase n=1 Tax=Marinihelvus fidelis TaxID=2613842 RepID=A0A5N0TCT0_9GAMM|nr:dTDP-4-dehydrorhamnose reductase [Marinihelvus fidelis]KAA9132561.1 dTDP-4-dehydrorhamnose reductase [Marinihelvus fidelis]